MNKLSDYLYRFLRLSSMKELALASVIATGFLVLLTLWLMFFSENKQIDNAGDEQFFDVLPVNVRNNDAYFHKFLENIKLNNGVLILGTSESGPLGGYNYKELLNSDPDIKTSFSAFYGAGRFCEKYIPLISNSPEKWKGLKILVFVNPIYWREGLNGASLNYQERYLNKYFLENEREKLENYDFEYLFGEVHNSLNVDEMDMLNYYVDTEWESLFYNNLNSYFNPNSEVYTSMPLKKEIVFNAMRIDSLKSEIDSNYNITSKFFEAHKDNLAFPVLDSSSYRFRALEAFIKICEDSGVKSTFLIGPYNGVMIDKLGDEKTKSEYKALRKKLVKFFDSKEQKVINATDLSYVNHTFVDWQHHSAYAGYLIYKRVKEYYD